MVQDMTKGSPVKMILLFALPMLAGNIFQQLYNIVDSIVVSHGVGVGAFASVGCTSSMNFYYWFCHGAVPGFFHPHQSVFWGRGYYTFTAIGCHEYLSGCVQCSHCSSACRFIFKRNTDADADTRDLYG